jgi:hypothetical protein
MFDLKDSILLLNLIFSIDQISIILMLNQLVKNLIQMLHHKINHFKRITIDAVAVVNIVLAHFIITVIMVVIVKINMIKKAVKVVILKTIVIIVVNMTVNHVQIFRK